MKEVVEYIPSIEVDKRLYSTNTNAFFSLVDKAFPPEENKTPDVHYKLLEHILNSKSNRIGICASRGLAKSRLAGNFLPIILPLLGIGIGGVKRHKFIMVISATFDGAIDMIQEVKDLYDTMDDKYRKLLEKGIWKADELSFTTPNGETISIVAMGAEGKIRGIRRKGSRPDLLIFDDSEYEELVLNPLRMKKWKRWVTRSAIPAMSPTGVVLWIGTPLPNSLLEEIKVNDKWDFVNFPIHDSRGVPAWIDRFNAAWIKEKKEEMAGMLELNAWYQEYELQIISEEEQIFKPSMLSYVDKQDINNNALDIYVMCDLAISSSSNADRTVFIVAGVDSYNNIHVLEIFAKRCPPSEQVHALMTIANKYFKETKKHVTIGMERGALKYAFMDVWNKRLQEVGYAHAIPKIRELDPYGGANSKNKRIQQLEPLFNRRSVKFVNGIDNLTLLEEELLSYPATKHDDIIDALSYLFQLVSWREDLPSEPLVRFDEEFTGVCW